MPLRNRVTPLGELIPAPARGLVYGNRGCLHDAHGSIRRRFAVRRWIACRLEFQGWQRGPMMQPGKFTELFFLDEATAFAAGHRPCALCRRDDYDRFGAIWPGLHGGEAGADAIDLRAPRASASTRRPAAPHARRPVRLAPRRRVRARRGRSLPRARRRAAAVVAVRLRRPPAAPGAGDGDRDHAAVARGSPACRMDGRRRAAAAPVSHGRLAPVWEGCLAPVRHRRRSPDPCQAPGGRQPSRALGAKHLSAPSLRATLARGLSPVGRATDTGSDPERRPLHFRGTSVRRQTPVPCQAPRCGARHLSLGS